MIWDSWSCVLGHTVSGVWPPKCDVTDVNSAHVSRDRRLVATADDFGMVKLFNYPAQVSWLEELGDMRTRISWIKEMDSYDLQNCGTYETFNFMTDIDNYSGNKCLTCAHSLKMDIFTRRQCKVDAQHVVWDIRLTTNCSLYDRASVSLSLCLAVGVQWLDLTLAPTQTDLCEPYFLLCLLGSVLWNAGCSPYDKLSKAET